MVDHLEPVDTLRVVDAADVDEGLELALRIVA